MSGDPKDGLGYVSRGMGHMREGRWAEAKLDFEQALRLELDRDVPPNERGIHYDRPQEGNCHLQLAAAHVELGDLAAAEAEIELAMQVDRSEPTFTARGALRLLRGNLPEALADLERALELDPKSMRARRHRATYFEKLGDPALAIAELEHALVENPFAEPERTRWLELRKQQGKSGEPYEVLSAPEDAQRRYLRGSALAQHEAYAAAIDDYSYALGKSPTLLHIYLNRGVAFSMLGKLEEALADFKRYEASFPEQAATAYYQGWALARAGQTAPAIAEYERALKLAPDDKLGIKKTLEELRAI
jgi:tetratricopeptide (TPR) repeat protein